MTRAAFYLRVSTGEQSIANQTPELERLAHARGLEVVERYEETASAAKVRPVHARMLDDARRGRFGVLLIWAIDRFGRSMVGNLTDILELDRVGVRVVSVREPWLDTSGPMRNLLLAIFSWVAEQERTRLIERTKAGMEHARVHGTESGKAIGRPRRLARVDVDRAAAMRAEGRSLRHVAMTLKIPRATLQRALAASQKAPSPLPPETPDGEAS